MGRLRTVQNISSVLSASACKVGDPSKTSWIINVDRFMALPLRQRYGHFVQKYNILPGQYLDVFATQYLR